jgi:hypothetical protein
MLSCDLTLVLMKFSGQGRAARQHCSCASNSLAIKHNKKERSSTNKKEHLDNLDKLPTIKLPSFVDLCASSKMGKGSFVRVELGIGSWYISLHNMQQWRAFRK